MLNQVLYLSHSYGPHIALLVITYWTAAALFMIKQNREPAITISWMLLFVLLPLFAPALYYIFGRNWPQKKQYPQKIPHAAIINQRLTEAYDHIAASSRKLSGSIDNRAFIGKIANALQANGQGPVMPGRNLSIFTNGREKFSALINDIEDAKDSIHLQYFIWGMDSLTARITDALSSQLARGIQVRILNDYIGCFPFPKKELNKLAAKGARVAYDAAQLRQANYRDHRKIVVVDGSTGYTGGMNMASEYLDGGKKFPAWRDTHLRFQGPIVSALQRRFAERWYNVTRENIFTERYFPQPRHAGPEDFAAQIVSQDVTDHIRMAKVAHHIAISGATRRVRIQSPYLVPDEGTIDVLMAAALGGVQLQLMMTGLPDKKLPFMAARTYWRQLIEAGCHIYLYYGGFMHAKTLTVDGIATAIGSLNVDIRSLKLHQEIVAWIYDEKITSRQDAIFDQDLQLCKKVTRDDFDNLCILDRLASSSARLASNLL